MVEFEQDGQVYKIGLIDAFDQILVARKMAPILGSLFAGEEKIEGIVGSISSLDDESTNVIFNVLLKVIQRKNGKSFANILVAPKDSKEKPVLMFDDIDGGQLVLILVESMKVNLGKPFATIRSRFKETQAITE